MSKEKETFDLGLKTEFVCVKDYDELVGLVKVQTACLKSQEAFNEAIFAKIKELEGRLEKIENKPKLEVVR